MIEVLYIIELMNPTLKILSGGILACVILHACQQVEDMTAILASIPNRIYRSLYKRRYRFPSEFISRCIEKETEYVSM